MATHPFFNAGVAPKRKAEHPLLSSAKRAVGAYRTALRNWQSGYLNEWDDELAAGVAAPVLAAYDYVKGDGFDVVKRYKEKQAAYDRIKKDDNAAHPIAATVGGVAGGLAQAVTAGAALKSAAAASPAVRAAAAAAGRAADAHPLIAGAALGAADAGLAGAGYADPGHRGEGAAWNALFGAALGGAGGAIGKYAAEAPYEPNRLNMFIGEKGATKAEKELLKEAKDMAAKLAKEGMSPEEIRILTQQKTGWAHNPAMDVWQMEISDLDAKIKPEFKDILANRDLTNKAAADALDFRATNAIDHPELFRRYPDMADTQVRPLGPYSPGYRDMRGSADFSPKGSEGRDYNRIRLWGDPSVDIDQPDNPLKSVLLHEMGHDVQLKEGWPGGANTRMFYNPDLTADNVRNMIKNTREMSPPDVLEIPAVKEELNWWEKVYGPARFREEFITEDPVTAASGAARELYKRQAGEVQARNIQNRLSMEAHNPVGALTSAPDGVPPMRYLPFENTQDVPYDRQHLVPQRLGEGISKDKFAYPSSQSAPEHPFFTQPELPPNRWGKPNINKRGDYMGAPPGINSPEAERALVGRIVDRVNSPEGVAGAGFYDDFSTQVARHTDDREKARVMAYMTAETSPSQSWNNNVNEGVKGFNQYQMGDPIRTGRYPNQTGELIEKNIDRFPGAMPPSDKTGPFGYNLISKDFPMNSDPKRAVFDMHEGRSFGFPEPDHNFTPVEHLYGDRISKMVQEATGLDHKQWQERDWAAIRTRDGLPMSKPQQQLFDESASFTQMEAIPGSTTGATTIRSMPDAAKQQYTDEMFDAAGGNELARMFGLSPELTPGYGKYEGVITPNRKIDVMTATKGSGKKKAIEASSDALMNNVRRMYQFVFGQNASYGTTYRPLTSSESAKNANMAYINLGKQMAGKEGNDTVMAALQRKLGDDWNAKVNPAPYRDGVLIGDISGMKPKQFQKLVNELNGELGGSGVELGRNVGFQMDDIDWSKGEWKQLLEGVRDNPRIRKIFDENVTTILERVQNKHEALGKSMGFDTNTMLDKVRNIAAKGGYGALMNAVKQGIIPAAAIGFILAVGVDEGVLGDRSS